MKLLLCLIVLSLTLGLNAQEKFRVSGVLDAHFVSEKYPVTASILDQGYNLAYDIYQKQIRDSLKLTDAQKDLLSSEGLNHDDLNLPYCYLLHEDDYWTQRVYRTIPLNDAQNAHFTKGGFREEKIRNKDKTLTVKPQYFPEQALMNVVRRDVERGYVTVYPDIHFQVADSSLKSDVLERFDEIDHLLIKEDWYYDKPAGTMKTAVIGVGFMLKGSTPQNRKPLFWAYYPELRYAAINVWVRIEPLKYFSWNTVIQEHHFASSDIWIDCVRNNQSNFQGHQFFEDYNVHRNDFHAMIHTSLIQEYVYHNKPGYNGAIHVITSYGMKIQGELNNGLLNGWVNTSYKDGNKQSKVYFSEGVAHGMYESYYPNGQLKEVGELSFGRKKGGWKSYHENGKLMSAKNYANGWLAGDQKVYYDNGKLHLSYQYKNHQIDGPFRWNDSAGNMLMQGQLKENYIDGDWKVNLPIPRVYTDIILANKERAWDFDVKSVKDGILSYNVKVEQYKDPLYCGFKTCTRLLNVTFD